MYSPLRDPIILNITPHNLLHLDFRLPLFDRGVVYPTGRHMCYGLFFNDHRSKSRIANMTSSELFMAESKLQYLSNNWPIDDDDINTIVDLVYLYKMYHYTERMVQNFHKLNELCKRSNRPVRVEHVCYDYVCDLFEYETVMCIEDYLVYAESNRYTSLKNIVKEITERYNRGQVWLLENGW